LKLMAPSLHMRVNLIAQVSLPVDPSVSKFPLSLTIRPAWGLPGDFEYPTDREALLRMLHQKTELPSSVLDRFRGDLRLRSSVRLLGVELSDRHLTEIGYFVD